MSNPIRLFSPILAVTSNTNAQNLNAREVALRLDPQLFEVTFYYRTEITDERLFAAPNIRLKRLPPRLGTVPLVYEMVWGGYDILFYIPPRLRALSIYWKLRRLGGHSRIVESVEASAEQLKSVKPPVLEKILELLHRADYVFGITPHISETVLAEFQLKIPVLPIGVDLRRYTATNRCDHKPPFKALFLGTMQPRKHPHLLIDMADLMRGEPVEFHFIGKPLTTSNEYYQELLRQKNERKLDNVLFHGAIPNEKIPGWMAQCDVLILPSRLEGMPKVTMEAAATGLPCIVFDDYKTPSVVDGVTGYQVKTFDEMCTRLRQLMTDPELRSRMGRAAVSHIQQFNWDHVAEQWAKMFQEVASKKL